MNSGKQLVVMMVNNGSQENYLSWVVEDGNNVLYL